MTTFGSVREALGFLYACRRGPALSRPLYTDTPRSTGRSWGDVLALASLLHSHEGCGVRVGSELDDALRKWSLREGGPGEETYTSAVRAVEDRMRDLLDRQGMRRRKARMPVVRRFDFTDADGRTRNHLVEALRERCTGT